MERSTVLSAPRRLEITGADGAVYYGADQEWYGQLWRRKAGCGPTAAAAQLAYLSETRPGLEALGPAGGREVRGFTAHMDAVWAFVTPGPQGLNTVAKYTGGVEAFAAARGVALAPLELAVPRRVTARPSFYDCAAFIRAGLEGDCPVAFLNLHNGRVENLDAWHWVLITELHTDNEGALCAVADGGKRVELDLRLWYDTTREGGGFVYLPPSRGADAGVGT